MPKANVYPAALIEAGQALPLTTDLPTDEALTAAVLAAGFTTCHGKAYATPHTRERVVAAAVKAELGVWPRGRAGRG